MTAFDSVSNLLREAEECGLPLWEYIMSASAAESRNEKPYTSAA